MSFLNILITTVIVALLTFLTRLVPFILFSNTKQLPGFVVWLGQILPYSVMAILVIYCLESTDFSSVSGFLPQLIAVLVVSGLHIWKRNNFLSIGCGTITYMVLVQLVFV